MASKGFPFTAQTVNGLIVNDPVTVIMRCDKVQPVGEAVVRGFDPDYCIVAIKVFLVLFNGDVYGTTDFKSLQDYWQYVGRQCKCCETLCYFTINGCLATINGCILPFDSSTTPCQLFINGCAAAINGCLLTFPSNN